MASPAMLPPPYTVAPMDAQQAQQLVEQGAAVLLLDVPQGCLIGVDHQVMSVGPKFKGIKMLPPGTHFLSCTVPGRQGGFSACSGFFVHVGLKQVVVKRYSPATEALEDLPEEEAARYAHGVRQYDFDAGMAPYDLLGWGQWQGISSHISQPVLNRLTPVGGLISVMSEAADLELMEPRTEAERKLIAHLQEGRAYMKARMAPPSGTDSAAEATSTPEGQAPGSSNISNSIMMDVDQPQLQSQGQGSSAQAAAGSSSGTGAVASTDADGHAAQASSSGRCFYTRLQRLVKSSDMTAAELTAYNMDKSGLLKQLLVKDYQGSFDALIGELQFAFVAFMFGQSLDGLRQWKALMGLLLQCEDAVLHTHARQYATLLAVIASQLRLALRDPNGPQPDSSSSGNSSGAGGAPCGVMFGSDMALVDDLMPDSFLRHQFATFFEILREGSSDVQPAVFKQAEVLRGLLAGMLGWHFDMHVLGEVEDDEYAPVVVEGVEEMMVGMS